MLKNHFYIMKQIKFLILALICVLMPTMIFAQAESDPFEVTSMVEAFSPFIVLSVTWIVKTAVPKMPGIVTLLIVTLSGIALTWITQLLGSPDLSWWAQFGYSLGAVFLNQISRQLK